MKKFITQIIIYTAVSTIVVVSLTAGIYFIQSRASFKLPPNKHILVLGDSHNECAINDDIYQRAANVSQGGLAYLYSHCKLKKFLDENKHIDTVLLSIHYPALTSHSVNDRLIFDERYMNEKVPLYLTLFSREEIEIFARKKTTFLKSIFHPPYKIALKFMMNGGRISYKDLGIGGYSRLDRHKLQEDIARRQNKQTKEEERRISFYQKEYLLKMKDLCKTRKVELILINPPTYKPEIYESIDKLNDYHNTYLTEVKYWDYSAFPLPDDCYGDIGHLNYKGAEIFSKYLQAR